MPLSKARLLHVSKLVEVLKIIEFTLMRKDVAIAEANVHMFRVLFEAIFQCIQPLRHKLESKQTSRMDATSVDLLGAVDVMQNLVRFTDTLSSSRRVALLLVTEIITSSSQLNDRESTKLRNLVKRVSALSAFSDDIRATCDTSFLYFHQDVLEPMVQSLYHLPTEVNRLQYIVSGFADGIKMCSMILHTSAAPYFIAYRATIRDTIKTCIVQPLCRDIEDNLRLHIGTKNLAHLATMNPKAENVTPLRPFLDMPPLRVLGLIIDIHHEVKHYLDTTFYNLTTVALHDWRTYV